MVTGFTLCSLGLKKREENHLYNPGPEAAPHHGRFSPQLVLRGGVGVTQATPANRGHSGSMPALGLAMVLTFTGPALMQLKRKDDVILILAELTDETLGLTQL